MKYNGDICNICGRPITETNNVPKSFLTDANFNINGDRFIEIRLNIKVSYGPYADTEFLKTDGHICFDCFKQLVAGIPKVNIPF